MSGSPLEVARLWVDEQLRYPQRTPRTSIVLDWSEVPSDLQRRLEDVARASGSIDYSDLPRRRWFSPTSIPALSAAERQVVAATTVRLEWSVHVDCRESRLVTVAENVVERIVSHPAWSQPALDGRQSVIAQHMELHVIAAAANQLLMLRNSTPNRPESAYSAQEEWNRRQAAFARSCAALIDRVAALRVIEETLDRIHSASEELKTVQLLSTDIDLADTLYRNLAGAELAISSAHAAGAELEDAEAGLRSQIEYLDQLIPQPSRSSAPYRA